MAFSRFVGGGGVHTLVGQDSRYSGDIIKYLNRELLGWWGEERGLLEKLDCLLLSWRDELWLSGMEIVD